MKTNEHKTMGKAVITSAILALLSAAGSRAAVRYVNVNSTTPSTPYATWATAATNIQDAVDIAAPGDQVLVTNGVYRTGGRIATGALTNRVAVTKPLIIQSVNGPGVTIIEGNPIYGSTAVRCVYLTNGAALSGFTLTNGATGTWEGAPTDQSGGGIFSESTNALVSNCVLVSNAAWYFAGGAFGGTLSNCTLLGNAGGGASSNVLISCTLTGHASVGAAGSTLVDCTLSGNQTGASSCTLHQCTLSGNALDGALYSALDNCTLTGNLYSGASGCTLTNCAVTGNYYGSESGILDHCTVTANFRGGNNSEFHNCLVYYNTVTNYVGGSLNYCCTTPMPQSGTGNITLEPDLTDLTHLSAASSCRGAGKPGSATGVDIDDEPWASPPAIGCDEFHTGTATGPLSVGIVANFTNVSAGFAVDFKASLVGRASANRWEFGDGTIVSNRPVSLSHSWAAGGDYPVTFRAYNDDYPTGVSATLTIHVLGNAVYYVRANSTTPVSPYTNWATAAARIQDALSVAYVGGTVLVSNGVYQTGQGVANGLTNRVAAANPMTVRSVNGPTVTTINGSGVLRCVYLADGAVLSGFTLTNGYDYYTGEGGGVYGGTVTNCVLVSNYASSYGGGAAQSTLLNCTVKSNSVNAYGGGVSDCVLSNCTLIGNSANTGGGAFGSTLNNCTLTGNHADNGGGGNECTLRNCLLQGNSSFSGAAAGYGCTLNNCLLTGNAGVGAYESTLSNCTVTGNAAGVSFCTLNNCIVYYNAGGNYVSDSYIYNYFNYSCTTPMPEYGVGNISNEPDLTDASHLNSTSPCRGAGSAAYSVGTDLDGEAWANPPSIGCDEFYAGAATGTLNLAISADYTNVATGFMVNLAATLAGHASANRWDFGDGAVVSNRPFGTAHAWTNAGNYVVTFRAYNDTFPAGISATLTVHVLNNPIYYVTVSNNAPASPYMTWAAAATNIQQAVDVAYAGATVLVSNGVYRSGGMVSPTEGVNSNRLVVLKPLRVQSVNGPATTVIDGLGQMRCAFLASNVAMTGFTLTNGSLAPYGGYSFYAAGVYGGSLSNCVLSGNNSGQYAGGAYAGVLRNCVLSGNSAHSLGGGALQCNLRDCILTGNSAFGGGGVAQSVLNNCVVSNNTAIGSPGFGGTGGGVSENSMATNCLLINNFASGDGGGAASGVLMNCIVAGNRATNSGGGWAGYSGLAVNCTFTGNWAMVSGGGVGNYGYLLTNCTLINNSSADGGGVYYGNLKDCELIGNVATNSGGGAWQSTLENCTLRGNSALFGGGSYQGTLDGCILTNNSAGNGGGAYDGQLNNCAILGNSATNGGGTFSYFGSLNNCTLSGNTALELGGGAYGGGLVNCILTNNTSDSGGAVYNSTCFNCILRGNSAASAGGGEYNAYLGNCTVVANSSAVGGGAFGGLLSNCILYYNDASTGPNLQPDPIYGSEPDYCCTTPLPTNGVANITNAPAFVDLAGGNLRLRPDSPCINSGYNQAELHDPDFDGNSRVVGGSVDIGAFEFQSPSSVLSYAWLQQYGLPVDGSADHADPDGDHFDNYSEWRAGTSPLDASSLLRMLSVVPGTNGTVVTWQSVSGLGYFLERSTNLSQVPPFTTVISFSADTNTAGYLDSEAVGSGPFFYRVRVE